MELTEVDCLNALKDRKISSIRYATPAEEKLVISTHDGLVFEIASQRHAWLKVKQVK